ncbi:MAG: transglycosylase domain-containing protein [Microthrixaceae bacterium]
MRRPIQLLLRFIAVAALGVVSIGLIASQMVHEIAKLPEAVSFDTAGNIVLPELPEGSTIIDVSGEPVGTLRGPENRIVVPLSEMSQELRDTVLAVEDADFYEHEGVSARSVLRAIKANSDAGGVSQGGSTITQQLVKLNLVGDDRTLERKIKEASLAVQLEDSLCGEDATKKQCKDIIFQQYMNQIYLGQGAYGVEAASRTYFDKSASEVNLAEAALLAALIKNPNNYDPIENPEVAGERRGVALGRMVDEGLIDQEQADFIDALPVPTQVYGRTSAVDSQSLTYVERKIRDELLKAEWLAPTEEERRYLIFNGGLRITSTIDQRAQQLAEQAVAASPEPQTVAANNPERVIATGLAAVEPSTGAVRAIVGEIIVNGTPIEIGDPVQGARSGDGGFSSGSAYKPITLMAALEQGYTIKDRILGDPVDAKVRKQLGVTRAPYPKNCPSKGMQTLSAHLKASNNCAWMRVQNSIGFDAVKEMGIRLGLDPQPLDPANTRAACYTIGCDALVSPLGMATAFATIVNDGKKNPAHFVDRVTDRDGNVLYQFEPPNEQVVSSNNTRQAVQAMEQVVTGGTCTRCQLPNRQPAAGKTGTVAIGANDSNIGMWFSGFTPHLATAVWVGDPLNQRDGLRGSLLQGGRSAGPVWQEFMAAYLEGAPVIDFADPGSVGGGQSMPDSWGSSSSEDDDDED